MNDYLTAVEREQRAWQALDGRLPGMTGCSPELWTEWIEATVQLNAQLARFAQGGNGEGAPPPQPRGWHRGGNGPPQAA